MLIEDGKTISEYRNTHILENMPDAQVRLQLIEAYLQGCVYSWCAAMGETPFAARNFLGGDNYYWQKTPVWHLYNNLMEQTGEFDYSFSEAAKAAGHILKKILIQDKRTFITKQGERSREYYWDKNIPEQND